MMFCIDFRKLIEKTFKSCLVRVASMLVTIINCPCAVCTTTKNAPSTPNSLKTYRQKVFAPQASSRLAVSSKAFSPQTNP